MPHYKRVKLDVTRRLSSGEFKPKHPLPTEKELAVHYDVSVGTIRRAMDELVAEHIVVRQQGRGTFLVPLSPHRMLNRFWPIFRKDGVRDVPIVQTLVFEATVADIEVAKALAIEPGEPVHHIVNLLLIGGNPVLLDDIHIPLALFPRLTEQEFISRETAMYGLYQSAYGISVIRTSDRLCALPAEAKVARYLGLDTASPVLVFDRIAYTFDDRPVERRRGYLNTTYYEYRTGVGGETVPETISPVDSAEAVD